ncbi:MAG: hypothetical protein JSS81_11420 [Acidobacteria bacterium]|nr:hypothetical protein [Acidobacteriota bacterium]
MKRIFYLSVLVMFLASAAVADIRVPDTPKPTPKPKTTPTPKAAQPIDTELSIMIRKEAKEARLLIPKSQLKQLRAQLDELDGGAEPTAAAFFSLSRTQTIVSGLFLSLAMVFGGVWLVRSRGDKSLPKPNKTLVAGAVLFLGGALATIVYANVGPPPEARSITGKLFTPAVHQYKQASGRIKLETTDEEYGVQLIVPDVPDDKKKTDDE